MGKTDLFNTEIRVRDKTIGVGLPPYIIAEMACAHDGDLNKAKALVDAAAEAAVDAIQLQLFSVSHQVAPQHQLYDLLCRLEFSASEWGQVFAHARQYDIAVFAFTYDAPSMQLALELGIDGIKLSSADLSNPEMIEAAAHSGLPITLGTGASTLDEIGEALYHIQRCGGRKVVLMHGVQNFPTAIEDANIRRIQLLQRAFQMLVGYQDHTDANLEVSKVIDLVAVGMGACIIEKHITLDRSEKGTDYQAALEPDELKRFVRYIREASISLGTDQIRPLTESDIEYRKFQKTSVVAACSIPQGAEITRDKVSFLRSDTSPSLSPSKLGRLLGKKTRRDIKKYEQIKVGDVVD
jgi:sialic acid synthase SpsE